MLSEGPSQLWSPANLEIVVHGPPIPIRGTRARKDALTEAIRAQTRPIRYVLTGDVKVDVEWSIHEQDRYESDEPPDVDNTLKPLLDAISGPEGILVDDTQVQEVSCRWISCAVREQSVALTIMHSCDEWLSKDGLGFVHLGKGLCLPVHMNLPSDALLMILDAHAEALSARDRLMARGIDYYAARSCMSIQRVFHRSRVSAFPVEELDDLRRRLAQSIPATEEQASE